MRISHLFAGATALGLVTSSARAQDSRVRIERGPAVAARMPGGDHGARAMLGIGASSGGQRDTLGVLVTSVTPGGPAEKAGIEEGNRIAAINGVNLKLSADDAGEPDMSGVLTSRLVRELRKVKPGDDVTLDVYADGRTRAVRVKTTEQQPDNPGAFRVGGLGAMREEMENRAAIGVGFGGGHSKRDTLGLLVIDVDDSGPAAKAGIEEGNRIAAINGVDLRVRAEDVGEGERGGVESQRATRELRKHKPGDEVELRVYADGQFKTVRVKTVKASELKNFGAMRFYIGNGATLAPSAAPRVRVPSMSFDTDMGPQAREEVRRAMTRAREEMTHARESAERARVEMKRSFDRDWGDSADRPDAAPRARARVEAMPAPAMPAPEARVRGGEPLRMMPGMMPGMARAMGSGDAVNFNLSGLRLVPMSKDLASYFGDDAINGLLVLDAGSRWTDVRGGDVLLSVNGKPVRDGDRISVSLDPSRDNELELLRKGKHMTITVPATRKEP